MRASWLVAGLLGVPIAVRAYIGTFSRFTADDFCWPSRVASVGFFPLQLATYQGAFGRWASTALISLLAYSGDQLVTILPALALLAWLAALSWLGYEVSHRLALSIIISELLILTTLAAAPDALQPIYWQTGMLTYFPPLFVLPAGLALVLRTRSPLAACFLAFLSAGFNEPTMAMQVVAFGALMPLVRTSRSLVVAAFLGSCGSAIVMLTSAGDTARRSGFHPGYLALVEDEVVALLLTIVRVATVPTLLFVVVVALIGHQDAPDVRLPRPSLIVIGTLALVGVGLSPAVYGFGAVPGRAAFVPSFVLVVGLFLFAVRLGVDLRALTLPAVAVPAVAVSLAVLSLVAALSLVGPFTAYAQAWDYQDATLRAASGAVQLTALTDNPFGLEDVGQPGSQFATTCALQFYGLQRIESPSRLASR